jgi:hypothetical protein
LPRFSAESPASIASCVLGPGPAALNASCVLGPGPAVSNASCVLGPGPAASNASCVLGPGPAPPSILGSLGKLRRAPAPYIRPAAESYALAASSSEA